jgi:hypothetical protein
MTVTHAHAAGAVDAKSRESPGAKVLGKHCARHRGDSTMTLNELRPGHQRIADIYGLPVNIIRDPLNGKFTAWLGQPGPFGAASGPIVETIVPQKAPEGPPKNHGLKRAMLTHALSAPKA